MTKSTADVIAEFVEAVNDHDPGRLEGLFGDRAVVVDDGTEFADAAGRATWVNDHTIVPRIRLSETTTEHDDEAGVVTLIATTDGEFPGGPYRFAFRFTIDGDVVSRLEISQV